MEKISRRQFLTYGIGLGAVAAGATTLYSLLNQKSDFQKVVDAVARSTQIDTRREYQDSKNTVIFLPDVHVTTWGQKQRTLMRTLEKNIEQQGLRLAGIGLEGVMAGVYSVDQLKEEEKRNDALEMERSKNAKWYTPLVQRIINGIAGTGRIDHATGQQIALAFNNFKTALWTVYHLDKVFDPATDKIDPVGCPGVAYAGVVSAPHFGLEDPQVYEKGIVAQLFQNCVTANQDCLNQRHNVSVLRQIADEPLNELLTEYDRKLIECQRRVHEFANAHRTLFEEKLTEEQRTKLSKVEYLDKDDAIKKAAEDELTVVARSQSWAKNIPAQIEGPVIVIGGLGHTPSYISALDANHISYVCAKPLDDWKKHSKHGL